MIKYKFISAVALFAASLAALFGVACTGYTEEEAVIESDKVEIFADGHDAVSFTVDFLGRDVTTEAIITNEATGEVVEGGRFTTMTAGTYSFVATYLDAPAMRPVTITAREASLALSTDYYAEGETSFFTFKAVFGTLDVSTDESLSIINSQTGMAIERGSDGYFKTTTTGDERQTYYGEWNGSRSADIVVGPVKFYKKVGILEFTGTWCQWCPNMLDYLTGVEMGYPDRYVLVAVHAKDKISIPYAATLESMFKVPAFPAAVIDFNMPPVNGMNTSASLLEASIREIIANNPAECGIAVSSTVDGNVATVNVTLLSAATQEYGIAVALTEDGIRGPDYAQKMPDGSVNYDYVHDHVLRGFYQDNVYGVSVGGVAAGAQAEHEFTFDLAGFDTEKCNIVVFATARDGENTVLENAAECKLGESLDFRYESEY